MDFESSYFCHVTFLFICKGLIVLVYGFCCFLSQCLCSPVFKLLTQTKLTLTPRDLSTSASCVRHALPCLVFTGCLFVCNKVYEIKKTLHNAFSWVMFRIITQKSLDYLLIILMSSYNQCTKFPMVGILIAS